MKQNKEMIQKVEGIENDDMSIAHPDRASQAYILTQYADDIMNKAFDKLSKNGLHAANDHIEKIGNPEFSAFIPAMALSVDHSTNEWEWQVIPTMVVRTTDDGLRYAAPDLENGGTYDNGPVSMITLIGDAKRPSALLVPLDNLDAITDGIGFLNTMHQEFINANNDKNENLDFFDKNNKFDW